MDELASGGEVFLGSRELVWCELVRLVSPLWWWLVLFIVALVLFPNVGGKGSHNDRI